MTADIGRAFARIDEGLVHYRVVGGPAADRRPLVLLHASPGSSRGLEPLLAALHARAPALHAIAPDTLGNGDSAPPVPATPNIAYFADAVVRLLDVLGIDRADLYGTHTGARIACEAGIQYPGRVGRVVFDGIGDYAPEMRELLLRDYAPEMRPDDYGRHLIWAFNFVRDQALHYPYFLRDPEHRLMTRPVPQADELHTRVVEVLKGLTSYHKSYRAAFAYPSADRLPLLARPALYLDCTAELPALRERVASFAAATPDARVAAIDGSPQAKAEAIAAFLGAD